MIVTLFAGSFTASAAETSNWGTRHEVCTELSTQAEDYYTGSYAYDSLSSKTGSSLMSSLRTLTTNTHSKNTSYENCKDYAYRSDCQNSDGTVVLLYTSYVAAQSDFSANAPGWNREHVWPKSLGGYETSGPGADMHHIRPDDVTTNSKRGNKLFGEVSSGSEATGSSLVGGMSGGTYSSSYFEPHDDTKGDVARICLYMHVRYGGSSSYNCDDITNVFSDVDTLLAWNALDPVDTWEMGRNDVVEGIQGNRNPFIDFPELAWLLFSQDIPSDLTTPSGGSIPAYNITATTNNSSYGSVSLTGKKITATPNYGYYVAGYTLLGGSATVTQEGNIFTVNPTSDCTIRINFAQKTSATVTFMQNGAVATTQSGYSEDVITLPSYTGTLPEGYAFVGWVKNTLSETTTQPATIYYAGSSYPLTSSETLYALYSRNDANGSGTTGEYNLFSGALEEGDYVISYSDGAMLASDSDENNRIDYEEITVTNDTVTDPAAGLIWHIAPTADGYYTIYNAANGVYVAGTGVKNNAGLIDSITDYAKWTVTGTSLYEFVNLGNSNKGVNANLRRNGSFGFACYSTSTGTALTLYQGVSGTIYYTTSATICSHSNTENVAAVAATCTSIGYTAGVYCNDCGNYISGHVEIAMLDHTYGDWSSDNNGTHSKSCACGDTVTEDCDYFTTVTAPTATQQGYTTYLCSICDYSYKADYTPALGYPVTISFSVPAGVTTPTSQSAYVDDTITLPTPSGTPSADAHEYAFVGWVEAAQNAATEKPTVYTAGSSYTVTGGKTLYALYAYGVSDGDTSVSGAFELLTSTPESWEGEYVLASADAAYVFLADGTTPNTASAAKELAGTGITLNGTTMSNVSDSYIIIIEAVGDYYSMRLKGAEETLYLKTTNSNSGFNTATSTSSDTALWTLAIDSNGAAVISNAYYTSRDIRFNSSSCQFRTYTSGQQDVYLYAGGANAVTTYYTTVLENASACTHANTSVNTVNATCTASGSVTTICTSCGEILGSNIIPATGHDYSSVVTAPTCETAGFTTYTCTSCSVSYTANETAATGHSYVYTNHGDKHTVSCENCSYSASESHNYTNGTCICGATESTEPAYKPDANLNFTMSIAVGAEMTVTYNIMGAAVNSYTDFYLEVKKDVAGGDPATTIYGITGDRDPMTAKVNPATGEALMYQVTYKGINAKEMGDNFSTTLYAVAEDGTIYYGTTVVNSIKSFLIGKINASTSSAELKTMAVDMLKYGAAAQVRLGYNTENLVTADLTEEQLSYATQEIPEAVNSAASTGDGASVNTNITVTSRVQLNLSCVYTTATDPNAIKCIITDSEGKVLAEIVAANKGNIMFSAIYENVGAKQMRDVINATFYEGESAISKTISWSVESYVAQVRAKTNVTEDELNMVNAMLVYGDAVAAYMSTLS